MAVHLLADVHLRDADDPNTARLAAYLNGPARDADVLYVLGDLFDVLDRFEMAMAHDVRRASALVQEGLRHKTPYAVPQLNSGVLLYRRSDAMLAFLREWAARFHAAPQVDRDQVILKDMLWEGDLRFWVLPPA